MKQIESEPTNQRYWHSGQVASVNIRKNIVEVVSCFDLALEELTQKLYFFWILISLLIQPNTVVTRFTSLNPGVMSQTWMSLWFLFTDQNVERDRHDSLLTREFQFLSLNSGLRAEIVRNCSFSWLESKGLDCTVVVVIVVFFTFFPWV